MPALFSISKRNKIIRKLADEILRSRKILIAAHKDPDPDAIGSTLGMWHVLKKRFPSKVIKMHNGTISAATKYRSLPGGMKISHVIPSARFDLLIALDAGNISRLGLDDYISRHQPNVIYIDHHQSKQPLSETSWVETEMESASQMVYFFAKTLRWQISTDAAAALMIGVAGDTLNFIRASAKVFEIAFDLMRRNPDFKSAHRQVFGWQSLSSMKLFGMALRRAEFSRDKRFIWSFVSRREIEEHGLKSSGLAYVSNALRDYVEAEVSLFLRQRNNVTWEGSLRSVDKHPTNLAKLAERFGGGGHFHAAGFESKMSRNKIIKDVMAALPNKSKNQKPKG